MGARQLRKIQLGAETSAGTVHAATTVWRGTGALRDDSVTDSPINDEGVLGGIDAPYIAQLGSSLQMVAPRASFEQLPYIFEGGIKKVGTGAADGSGSDKIYSYPMSSTSQNTLQTYSIEGGDSTGAEVMLYSYVSDFKLSGQIYKYLTVTANWQGRGTAPQAFTAGQVPPTVNAVIPFGTGKFYIDETSGTIGTTQVSGSLRQIDLSVKTGAEGLPSVENLYYTSAAVVDPVINGSMIFYWDSHAIAEKAKWLASTTRQVQLTWTGPAVLTPGTTYSKKTFIIQLYGFYWTKVSELQDGGGHNIVTASFECRYDLTKTNYANFIVVNELSALA